MPSNYVLPILEGSENSLLKENKNYLFDFLTNMEMIKNTGKKLSYYRILENTQLRHADDLVCI